MTRVRFADEPLRVRALEVLGPLGDPLAREALEAGEVLVERDVLAWEGSHGSMHAHRVIVSVPGELATRLASSHAARDGLSAALAAAMADRAEQSVADVRIEVGERDARALGPYRDPRPER